MSVLINRKYINKEYITKISNELAIQKIHSKQTKFNDLNNSILHVYYFSTEIMNRIVNSF